MRSPESMSIGSTRAMRKERSLSSLVTSTVSAQAGLSYRTKAVARKVDASSGINNLVHNGRDVDVDILLHSEGLESLEYPNKMFMRRKRNSGSSPSNHVSDDNIQSIAKQVGWQKTSKATSLEPVPHLTDMNRTDISQSPFLPLSAVKTEESNKYRSIEHTSGMKMGSIPINSARKEESVEVRCGLNTKIAREFHAAGRERMSITRKETSVALKSDSSVKHEKSNPVWLALRASDTKSGDNALPQIPKCYLRIINGNVPVLYVKKYLVKKLGLKNLSDVELKCCGQSIVSRLPLYSLLEFWLECAAPSDWLSFIQETDLRSAEPRFKSGTVSPIPEEFLMVLIYGRKYPRG